MINTVMNLWRKIKTAHAKLSLVHAQSENENGQILIIILLVLVVGVSIVLSLASRSLTDIRTTTSTEQSNRAYFAAEAGVERALQQIKDNNVTANITGSSVDLSNGSKYVGTISTTGGEAAPFYYDGIKDITIQTNLKSDINNDATGLNGGRLIVYWHTKSSPVAADTAALEVTVLKKNADGSYLLEKYACDPILSATRQTGNGFNCTGSVNPINTITTNIVGNNCNENITTSNKGAKSFCYKAKFPISATAGDKTLLVRIRPLYSNDSVAVGYYNSNNPEVVQVLPQQGYKITSTGTASDGSTRKLEVYRSYPSLPTVFDFVLFNGSSNPLTKP